MQSVPKSTEEPQAIEAEAKIIGAIIVDPTVLERIGKMLRYDHFHDTRHRLLYHSITHLYTAGDPVTAVSISDWLRQQNAYEKAGGGTYLMDLMAGVASTNLIQIDHYCRIVTDRYLQRSLANFGRELIETSGTTSNPHELIKLSTEALAKMNGSVGGGDQRILQSAIKGSSLFEKEIPKPESIVGEGVMTESSFVLLYGKPGLGKTWLALQMALAIAGGTNWLGIPTQKRKVGIIELEMHEYYLQQRLRVLTAGMDPDDARETLANVDFLVRPGYTGIIDLMEASTRDGIINWILGNGIGVLMLDAMSRCHFAAENNAQDMGKVLGSIERIRDETGAGITGVHHEPKEGKEKEVSDLDAARGSSRFQSDPHTMMRLKIWKGKPVLAFAKMNLGPALDPIFLDRAHEGYYRLGAKPDDASVIRDRNLMKVEEILLRMGTSGATTKLVASELSLAPRTCKKYLDEVGDRTGTCYFHKSLAHKQLKLSGSGNDALDEPLPEEDEPGGDR